jgi:hypothetical protein
MICPIVWIVEEHHQLIISYGLPSQDSLWFSINFGFSLNMCGNVESSEIIKASINCKQPQNQFGEVLVYSLTIMLQIFFFALPFVIKLL